MRAPSILLAIVLASGAAAAQGERPWLVPEEFDQNFSVAEASPAWIGWVEVRTRLQPGPGCERTRSRETLLLSLEDGRFTLHASPGVPRLRGEVVAAGRKRGAWALRPDEASIARYGEFFQERADEACDVVPPLSRTALQRVSVRLDRTGERLTLAISAVADAARQRVRGKGVGGPPTGTVAFEGTFFSPWGSEPAPAGETEEAAGLSVTSWNLLMLTAP